MSGQTCAFGGLLGQDLSTDDRIAIANTCGILAPLVHRFGHRGVVRAITSSGAGATWGSTSAFQHRIRGWAQDHPPLEHAFFG